VVDRDRGAGAKVTPFHAWVPEVFITDAWAQRFAAHRS
jgi:hypothetical protein